MVRIINFEVADEDYMKIEVNKTSSGFSNLSEYLRMVALQQQKPLTERLLELENLLKLNNEKIDKIDDRMLKILNK